MTTAIEVPGRPFAIAGVEISDKHIKAAEKHLTADYPFVIFSIAHCTLVDEKATKLFQAALNCPTILGLMCAGTSFGPTALNEIKTFIEKRPVTSLCLRDCQVTADALQIIGPALKTSKMLQELNLSENPLGNEGASQLATALDGNTSIASIDLEQCELDGKAITSLEPVLRSAHFEKVNLAYNKLGDSGAKSLAISLKSSRPVSLKLDACELTTIGLAAIVKTLTANPERSQLKALSLNHNKELGDEAMQSIALLLEKCPTISSLGLVNCNISSIGVAHLEAALAQHPEEIRIDMGANSISDDGFTCLNRALSGAKRLRWVAVDDPADKDWFYVLTAMAGSHAHAVHQRRQIDPADQA